MGEGNLNKVLGLLGCKLSNFPFTDLGLHLSAHRLGNEDFTPICQAVERRLTGVSTLLSYDGSLQLIKIYFLCPLNLFHVCTVFAYRLLGIVAEI